MKKANKAAMLSALICPGLGLFHLKQRLLGAAFMLAACAPLFMVAKLIFAQANKVVDRILSGEVSNDFLSIHAAVTELPKGEASEQLQLYTLCFIGVWLISIALSYMLGRRLDKQSTDRDTSQ
ncbi:hypothetical protein EXU30_08450 [Shewanella maritima]|uniref:DUF5683 domain-containing protein n=1 Tax=Shewanella maritima TaxID=2520507 RepID=A0A411PGJ5_9GAMM|nr:hypothetical protein [Shewanella maritima]QBF82716.1 hypothetical protein EXU30_08450 [Shewanella maritima]